MDNEKRTERFIDELDTLWEVLMKNETDTFSTTRKIEILSDRVKKLEGQVERLSKLIDLNYWL